MPLYGQDFSDYITARTIFFAKEEANQPWVWLGVLTHFVLIVAGVLLLPLAHLSLWAVTMAIAAVILLSGLFSIVLKQRKYSSFDRWLKHREQMENKE